MTTRSWIRKLFESRRPRTLRKAPARRWLSVEALEERAVPTVSFGPAVAYSTGGPSPHSVVAGNFNGHFDLVDFMLPELPGGNTWTRLIDTNVPDDEDTPSFKAGSTYGVTARSLLLFVLSE